MKNKLIDVHNSLMLSLEMLDDDEIFEDAEKGQMILERAKVKVNIAKEIVEVDRLGLDALRLSAEECVKLPSTLMIRNKEMQS